MKIKYDKKGVIVICIVFLLSIILNAIVENNYSFLVIPYTIGVFLPYFIFLIIYFLYSLIRYKELSFYTDWRVSIFLIFLELLTLWGSQNKNPNNTLKQDLSKSNLTELNDSELFKISFKKFLKEKNINMDIDVPNQYETLQPKNKYSNHYFNVTTDFPDNWEHDRGVSDYAIFRTFNADSAVSLALIAIPVNSEKPISDESHKDFQLAPLKTFNNNFGGDYKSYLLKQLSLNTTKKIYDFEFVEKKIRSTNYLIHSYKYNETVEGVEYPFITTNYQTILWGVSYTFGYSVPLQFYNPIVMETVMNRTNFINPKL